MSGWVVGFAALVLVAIVVVVLLLLMISGARKVAAKAEATLAALVDARETTSGLWLVTGTNAAASRIVEAATAARGALEGGR